MNPVRLLGPVLLGLAFSASSLAFYPVDGWWWNPNESGRGFQIEMQDDEMFIAAFHYAPGGRSLWWVANGRYNHSTGRMSGEFLEFRNGQCPGCPYPGFPDVVPGGGSPLTIDFHGPVTATLHWAGESIPIQRQYWRFDLNDLNLFLLGEFHFTTGALGVYFGQRLFFDNTLVDDGEEFVTGRVRDGSAQRVAVGHFSRDLGLFTILVDSSESFFSFFAFDMTKDRLEGRNWTFRKDEDLSGSGLAFIGHRVASRAFVQTGVGPHGEAAAVNGQRDLFGEAHNRLLEGLQLEVAGDPAMEPAFPLRAVGRSAMKAGATEPEYGQGMGAVLKRLRIQLAGKQVASAQAATR